MSAIYCIKKILYFSEPGKNTHAISNYFRVFLWLLVIHGIALTQGQEFFIGLLYGPLLLSMVFKLVDREINRGVLLLQLVPFLVLSILDYWNSYNVSNSIQMLTIASLGGYSIFLATFRKYLQAGVYRKSLLYGVLFLVFLLIILSMALIEEYSYFFILVSPKVSLAIFLICSITICSIYLIRDQIPGFVQPQQHQITDYVEDTQQLLVQSIEQYFNTSTQYLNSCFTFEKFSKEIGIPKNILSTVLNREMNKSFYQLLAENRIEYAKTLLTNQDYLFTIEAVVYECGFNSKSSFNRYFKQFVGCTPSDFRCNYLKKNKISLP